MKSLLLAVGLLVAPLAADALDCISSANNQQLIEANGFTQLFSGTILELPDAEVVVVVNPDNGAWVLYTRSEGQDCFIRNGTDAHVGDAVPQPPNT